MAVRVAPREDLLTPGAQEGQEEEANQASQAEAVEDEEDRGIVDQETDPQEEDHQVATPIPTAEEETPPKADDPKTPSQASGRLKKSPYPHFPKRIISSGGSGRLRMSALPPHRSLTKQIGG